VTFTLRGPGPTCRTAAVIRVAGHRGVNEVKLTRLVRGRKLPAGTYRLAPKYPAKGKPLGIYVSKAGQVVPLIRAPRAPKCAQPATAGLPFFDTSNALIGNSPTNSAPATAGVSGAKTGGVAAGRVALPRTPTGIRGNKIAKSAALVFDESPTSVLRFLSIVLGVLLALTIPIAFVAAAWRDLHRG
jgi:hypothetical protein